MANKFTTITIQKVLLEKLKESKKNLRRRSYGELFEHWFVIQKSYVQLGKLKELREISNSDLDKAEAFSRKLDQINRNIITIAKRTSINFNFILERLNRHEKRLNIQDEKLKR